jgi:8-oxo-dGTP pyrophosphatase MutT (NUDIX family)
VTSHQPGVVRAAGGVVWRRDGEGRVEVLLVHRPKYDDWSLPKGKLDAGEVEPEAALREVQEETGLRCSLGREVGSISYTDNRGRPKEVRYWSMSVLDGEFRPNTEVDEARWVRLDDGPSLLSYERDRVVLSGFEP